MAILRSSSQKVVAVQTTVATVTAAPRWKVRFFCVTASVPCLWVSLNMRVCPLRRRFVGVRDDWWRF